MTVSANLPTNYNFIVTRWIKEYIFSDSVIHQQACLDLCLYNVYGGLQAFRYKGVTYGIPEMFDAKMRLPRPIPALPTQLHDTMNTYLQLTAQIDEDWGPIENYVKAVLGLTLNGEQLAQLLGDNTVTHLMARGPTLARLFTDSPKISDDKLMAFLEKNQQYKDRIAQVRFIRDFLSE